MSARDVVAQLLIDLVGMEQPFADSDATDILSALTAAGYRIVPPGGLDAETVAECRRAVRNAILPFSEAERTNGDILDDAISAALRSLIEEPTNDAPEAS